MNYAAINMCPHFVGYIYLGDENIWAQTMFMLKFRKLS